MAKKAKDIELEEEHADGRGAIRTKEQREFHSSIVVDYVNLFKEKYMDFFRNLANTYTTDSRVDEETWQAIYDFVKDAITVLKVDGSIFTEDRIEKLKYIKEPSALYRVREKERMSTIKSFIKWYDNINAEEPKTKIQAWHHENEIASALYHIYMHMFLYLCETKK